MGNQLLRVLKQAAKIALALSILFFLGRYIYLRWQEVASAEFSIRVVPATLALGVLLFFYALYFRSWRNLLLWLSSRAKGIPWENLNRAFFLSFVLRYLPAGKILNIGSRIELLRQESLDVGLGATSVYYEQIYLAGGALLLAWIAHLTHPFRGVPSWLAGNPLPILAAGPLLAMGLLLLPDALLGLAMRVLRVATPSRSSFGLTLGRRGELLFRFLLANLAQGVAAYLFLWSIYPGLPLGSDLISAVIAAYPLSRLIGQTAAVVPGGLGVREGIFVVLLGNYMPVGPVLLGGAVMRLGSVGVELAAVGLATILVRHRTRRGKAHSQESDPDL